MTAGIERKVETRFARRAAKGQGVAIDEAVAAAEARLDDMRDGARDKIGVMIARMQGAGVAVDTNRDALRFVRAEADALVGLCGLFGPHPVEQAASSLCQLYDTCDPDWPAAEGVRVHLAAIQLLWSLPEEAAILTAPKVLEGLLQVSAAGRRRP